MLPPASGLRWPVNGALDGVQLQPVADCQNAVSVSIAPRGTSRQTCASRLRHPSGQVTAGGQVWPPALSTRQNSKPCGLVITCHQGCLLPTVAPDEARRAHSASTL